MSNKADNLNNAIVEKVKSILDNTECINDMHICIKGSRGVAPTITYSITEFITQQDTSVRGEENV